VREAVRVREAVLDLFERIELRETQGWYDEMRLLAVLD